MTDQTKILDKIKKCLALSASSEPHEAAAALRQAQKLMELRGFTQADVGIAEITEVEVKSAFSVSKVKPYELKIMNTVAKAFGLAIMWRESRSWRAGDSVYGRYVLIGLKSQVEVAQYTATVLVRKLQKASAAYVTALPFSAGEKTIKANGFCLGWADAIGKTVMEFSGAKELEPKIDAYKAKHYPGSVKGEPIKQSSIYASDLEAGMRAASGESLFRPMHGREAQLRIGA